jgi:hypothetical protein
MKDPESIVKAFVADYCRWNDRANELCAHMSIESLAQADAEYTDLLSRYCRPDLHRQKIAFSSSSSHSPQTEEIREATVNEGRAIVKTTNKDHSGFESDYEYLFSFVEGRWLLEALDYVNEEGRYPCL